jgi:hypothetical protein
MKTKGILKGLLIGLVFGGIGVSLIMIKALKNNNDAFPLKKGSSGKRVKSLQKFLNNSGSYGLKEDGNFNEETKKAVISEQNPFDNFKKMYPEAVNGQVSEKYYNLFIKDKF